jgi:uncharacterized protein (TIGR02231 family)
MRIATALIAAASPLALAFGAPASSAADIDAASRIEAVTVFPDGAAVTRAAEIDLPQGASTLYIRGLPNALDPASLKVEAKTDGTLAIGSVEARLAPGDAKPVIDEALEAKIAALRREIGKVAARLDALEMKRKSIERFAQADPAKLTGDGKALDPQALKAAWDLVGDASAGVNEDIRAAKEQKADLDHELAALEAARPRQPGPGAPKHDVAIALEAGGPVKGRLTLVYRVGLANWTPRYEARLDTGDGGKKPALDLVRLGQVTQRTGEDWSNAELTLSTVRTQGGTQAPDVDPLIVSFDEYYPIPYGGAQPRMGDARAKAAPPAPAAAPMATRESQPARPVLATLEAGAFQASFKVAGKVSVPRDGSPKTFTLSQTTLAPTLTAHVAPALDQTAYLEVGFTDDEQAPLLPGPVAIQRDGVFVGTGRLPLVAPGDKATLGMGADDRVKVTRVPLRDKGTEPSWIGNTRTQVTEFKTSVKNLHATPIHVTVTDRIPVSDINQIVVDPLPSNTPATEKVVADKRGVSAWSFDLDPSQQKDIRFGWRMKWPADRDIFMHAQPR